MEQINNIPILVIGDSHTRAYSFNPNFFPTFVGAGKENCFINDETYSILKTNIVNAIEKLNTNNPVILFLGEPDTRYYLGKGWYPWQSEDDENIVDYKKNIDRSSARYRDLIRSLKKMFTNQFIIHNITPSQRNSQNILTNYFNSKLKQISEDEDVLFLDINQDIYSGDQSSIKEKYLGDHVHLNNQIQVLTERILINKKLLKESGFNKDVRWSNDEMIKKFAYDEKFGCYKIINDKEMNIAVSTLRSKIEVTADSVLNAKPEMLEILKKYGIVISDIFYSGKELELLNSEFGKLLQHNEPWIKKIEYSNGRGVSVWTKEMDNTLYPTTHKVFTAPFMDKITKTYFNDDMVRSNIGIYFVNDVEGTRHHANDLHIDVERSLKFFIYLTDTTTENGAFFCAPGSKEKSAELRKQKGDKVSYENRELSRDLPIKPDEVIPVEGKAGTLIIFDTDVFHRAGIVTKGERKVMRGFSDIVSGKLPPPSQNKISVFKRIANKLGLKK